MLKPGGKLLTVFPSFFGAREHHLSMVTRAPFIHYFFSAKTLLDVYNEILEERGEEATYWYRRSNPEPEPWERGHTINGMTKWRFRKLIRNGGWKIVVDHNLPQLRNPIRGTIWRSGSYASGSGAYGAFSAGSPLSRSLLSRIAYVLEKR